MIQYFIERDGFVIAEGFCPAHELSNVDPLGGVVVTSTSLPKAGMSSLHQALIKRQGLLSASDWTQLPDVPLATKEVWAVYRQALRDITEQPGFPDVTWPTPPG